MSVVDEHAVVDNCSRAQGLELLVGIQGTGAEFKTGKIARANKDRSVDGRWSIRGFVHPRRILGGKWLAGDPVVSGVNDTFGKINKPAILNVVLIKIAFDSFELLAPIGIRVAEQSVDLGRSPPEFVGVGKVRGIGARRREGLKDQERDNDVTPAAIVLDGIPRGAADENGEEEIYRQDVADADVHAGTHGDDQVKDGRDREEENFAPGS